MTARRPYRTWWTAAGISLRIRAPSPGDPVLAHWWSALQRAALVAAADGLVCPLHPDEFEFVGHLTRRRPANHLWIYLHVGSQGELYVDDDGQTYRLAPVRNTLWQGRFRRCDIRKALWHAGVPNLSEGRSPALVQRLGHGEPPEHARAFGGPRAYAHGREAQLLRRHSVQRGFASGRMPRWPLGPGRHRAEAPAAVDEFGRCPDHHCDRCYIDPPPAISADLLKDLAAMEARFRDDPRNPPLTGIGRRAGLTITGAVRGPGRAAIGPAITPMRLIWPPPKKEAPAPSLN